MRQSIEFARFVIAGAANTAFAYGIYLVLLLWLPYLVAYACSYFLSLLTAYWLNARFVFRKSETVASIWPFLLVYFSQYVIGSAILWFGVDVMALPPQWGPALAIAITAPATYIALNTFSFNDASL